MQEEKAKNDAERVAMAESQVKVANAELEKAKAQSDNVQLKAEVDQTKNLLTLQKQQSDNTIQSLKQQLDEVKTALDVQARAADREQKERSDIRRTAIELTRIEKDSQKEENKNLEANKESAA